MENEILSKRIKSLRENKGWFQKDVAEKLNVKSNTLSGYENGTRSPDPDMLSKIADLYGVSVDYLLGRDEFVDSKEYQKRKIVEEYSDADLMFEDLESLTLEQYKEVRSFIKYVKSKEDNSE